MPVLASNRNTALFVTTASSLLSGGGGVQWCTREYRATLLAAGFETNDFAFATDRSLRARLRRRLMPRPHDNSLSPGLARKVADMASATGARWLFLNNAPAAALAPDLRRLCPRARLVFLSHGAEITDVVNNLRLAPSLAPAHQRSAVWLGKLLHAELEQRLALDATVAISLPDVEVERWLGAKNILFLPRQIPADDLPLAAPIPGRIGCVATLDHGPNFQGLELLAEALARHAGVQLRVVGGPEPAGRALAARFPGLHYCGRLDDSALRAEAAGWRVFANPIFCPARGASTKVATALGWGLPVLTTPDGARGYAWSEQELPLAKTPQSLAALAAEAALSPDHNRWRQAALNVRRLAPDMSEASRLLRDFLHALP